MNVIIPMAGIGSRLRPITPITPKPLISLVGKTIIYRIIAELYQYTDIKKIGFILQQENNDIEKTINSSRPPIFWKDKDNVKAINSGGKLTPPSYINDVVANCFNTGISKESLTPPIRKLKIGKAKIKPNDIKKTGICFP